MLGGSLTNIAQILIFVRRAYVNIDLPPGLPPHHHATLRLAALVSQVLKSSCQRLTSYLPAVQFDGKYNVSFAFSRCGSVKSRPIRGKAEKAAEGHPQLLGMQAAEDEVYVRAAY